MTCKKLLAINGLDDAYVNLKQPRQSRRTPLDCQEAETATSGAGSDSVQTRRTG